MKKAASLLLPALTILLELLPGGAVLVFAPSPTERVRETYPYFSLTPLGYANAAPLITAALTCVLLGIAVIRAVTGSRALEKPLFILSAAAAVISVLPLLGGIEFYSVVGGIITAALAAESALAWVGEK